MKESLEMDCIMGLVSINTVMVKFMKDIGGIIRKKDSVNCIPIRVLWLEFGEVTNA